MQHKWVQFLIYLVKNFIDDNCTQKASSLTYTTLLSIVPIFTLVVVILSSIPQLAEAKEQHFEEFPSSDSFGLTRDSRTAIVSGTNRVAVFGNDNSNEIILRSLCTYQI